MMPDTRENPGDQPAFGVDVHAELELVPPADGVQATVLERTEADQDAIPSAADPQEAAAADLDGDDYDLRAEMADLSISPALLADLTGTDRSTIWRWMNGRTPVPEYVKTILMLRRTLRHLSGRLLEMAKGG